MRPPRGDRYTRELAALARPQMGNAAARRDVHTCVMTERVTGAPAIHLDA